jgi:parallel beta-helix repeat protein
VVHDNPGMGIEVTGSGSPEIANCEVADNREYGVLVGRGAAPVIRDCTVSGNAKDGVLVAWKGTSATLSGTICADNGGNGLTFRPQTSGSAEDNTCRGNGGHGIAVFSSDRSVDLAGNRVESNGDTGFAVRHVTRPQGASNVTAGNRLIGENEVVWLFRTGQFGALEHLQRDLLTSERRTPDGEWQLKQFHEHLLAHFEEWSERRVRSFLETLDRWQAASPDSPLPLLIRASAEVERGWHARGGGWAHEVTEEGWEGFDKHLDEAWTLLDKAEALGNTDPELYTLRVRIAYGQGRGNEVERQAVTQGAALKPLYYPLYRQRLIGLLPRWGGVSHAERGLMLEMAPFWAGPRYAEEHVPKDVAKFTADVANAYGEELYGVNAIYLLLILGQDEFLKLHFNWPRIQRSFDLLLARFPGSGKLRAEMCRLACAYRDRDRAARLFAAMGEDAHWRPFGLKRHMERFRAWATGEAGYPRYDSRLRDAIRAGRPARVTELLAAGVDPNAVGGAGTEPLRTAALEGDLQSTRALLRAGADPDLAGSGGWTALHYAANDGHGRIVAELVTHGADVSATLSEQGWTALHMAVKHDDPDMIRTLLNAGADPNACTESGMSALTLAARLHASLLPVLLEAGADPNHVTEYGVTPLTMAIYAKKDDAIRVLVSAGADPNYRGEDGRTALLVAAEQGLLPGVKALLAHDRTDPAALNAEGEDALMIAARRGKLEVVQYLADEAAFPLDRSNAAGQSALDLAAAEGHDEVAEYLRSATDAD